MIINYTLSSDFLLFGRGIFFAETIHKMIMPIDQFEISRNRVRGLADVFDLMMGS